MAKFKDNGNVAAHVSEFARILTAAHDRCFGISPTKTLVWNLPALNDHGRPGAMQGRAGRQVTIDFAAISVGWLRDLTQLWIAAEIGNIPPSRIPDTIRAVTAASEALSHRPGGGQDPTEVTVADLDAIIDAIRHLTNLNAPGRPLASKTRAGLVVRLFDLLEYGHAHGHLIALAPSFYRRPHHRIQVLSHENEERSRQGLPDHVIDLLDGHLDLIAASNPYPGLTHEQRQQMGRCLYILLRDTGRRPYEICTLRRDCLIDGPEPELLWNNSKSNRPSRRLPITGDTAAEIRAWQGVRSSVLTAPTSDDFLFPGRHPRPASHEPHLSTKTLRKWIADWAAHVNDVAQDHLGRAHPLENIRVFPYSFRHSYAQRHVDAGVDVDVLRELMDHKSIAVTIGYYDISTTRKRAAVSTVANHVIDRNGKHVPTNASTYGLRTIAVPYGSCTEPANVKSGGSACPIRYRCAGCGFFRSDPSYIPALEMHVLALKTNRETAIATDTADFVISSLTAEIEAFTSILHTMRDHLESLDPSDRDKVDDACTTLRNARTTSHATPLPMPRTRPPGPEYD
ncbi:tyrosine-type recombinase/integrase [Tsukamurella strandjordii]|uniref:Tyrosine-type recombinase/integrase n=1 Tax=Tsukamurella strandjordii TaxID=147577 RepID=A0AA90NMV5_9ACTN|nr:tyrosine-type recombinase/integrase [Tsukamurella strandjordii]MDP0400514.1 tyrosine-type recombinase/integrase [Tsukamurella strandjordii]